MSKALLLLTEIVLYGKPKPAWVSSCLSFFKWSFRRGFFILLRFFLGLIPGRKSWPAADFGKGGDSERKKDRDRQVV